MGEEGMEKDVISASPNIVMSKGGNLRRSSKGQAIRRSSLPVSSSSEKVLPHYLRASTNSCHDFCKYGREHVFEAKENCLMPHKVMGDTKTSVEGQDQLKSVDLGSRKKKPLIKFEAAPELKIGLLEKPKIVKQKALPSVRKTEISIKLANASKQRCVTAKSPSPSSFSQVASGRSSVNSPLNQLDCISGKRNSDSIHMNPYPGSCVVKTSLKSTSNPTHLGSGRNSGKNSLTTSGRSPSVKSNTPKELVKNIDSSRVGEKKTLKFLVVSLPPKPSVSRVTSFQHTRYQKKASSPMMNRDKAGKAEPRKEIMQMTLCTIEPKLECKTLEPIEHDETIYQSGSLLSLSSCPSLPSNEAEEDGESESELSEGDNTDYKHEKTGMNRAQNLKGGQRRQRRSQMIHLEDDVPEKLKFQRGKVVSPVPENNDPRRLRFRTGRVVGENRKDLKSENNEMRRLKFRQGGAVGVNLSNKVDIGRQSFRRNRVLSGGDVNAAKVETPTVVLRHQDVQSKKEKQGLLNHVIEETANKLVETKMSKVKALVGAFETIISLQERKPATFQFLS